MTHSGKLTIKSILGGNDCDDLQGANFPGNTELCDGIDNNCDSWVDEGFDGDGDGVASCFTDGWRGSWPKPAN